MKLLLKNWNNYLNESQRTFYYHITKTTNVPFILKQGLIPKKPTDFEDVEGVYLFKSIEDAEDAVMNWLGDRFDEDEELTLLKIDSTGIKKTEQGAAYEIISKEKIEPQFLSIVKTL